jgi:hypothetical protein
MGSGAGDATKPSNSLMRETVAALTFGPVHWRGKSVSGEARARETKGRRVEKCISDWILGLIE